MELEELENRINENTKKLEALAQEIENNLGRIHENRDKIHQNTGALEILRGFKAVCMTIFAIWVMTFVALMYFVLR